MRLVHDRFTIATKGQGLHEITATVIGWTEGQKVENGILTLFLRHTSASLLIQENAAREVRSDLEDFFRALVPEDLRRYRHVEEGADDMPAHIRSALLPVQLSIPVEDGRLGLGTWQGVYLFEHRRAPHHREITLSLIGV